MAELRKPGTDPAIHDHGDHTPAGFIQHAESAHHPAVHAEAVELIPHRDGKWQHDNPEPFVRLVIGRTRDGSDWEAGHTDLTVAEARDLVRHLQVEIRRVQAAKKEA